MKETEKSIFEERYRVVAVESDRLLVRGVLSGEMLTIINPEPETPLTQEDYPPGKLIALTDRPVNCAPELGLSTSTDLQAIWRISLWPEAFLDCFWNRAILNIAPSSTRRIISVDRARIVVGSCDGQTRHGTIAASHPRPIPRERYHDQPLGC